MSEIANLQPVQVWKFFDPICSIPHISKHEAALAAALADAASAAGLTVECDPIGNVIIRREASPGWENAPQIILQAHMDMVPASEKEFDFISTPITPYIDGEWVRARGTTLGADDGIGVAHAMAIVTDREFECGKLTVILTVDEENGMSGAANLAPAALQGKYMLNLDGSDRGFCIGCAGGARQEFSFSARWDELPENMPLYQITIDGLPGGHSGLCIHENRGNAIKFMAEFISQIPDARIISFNGGTADNAIPYQSAAIIATANLPEVMQSLADAFIMTVKSDTPAAGNMVVKLAPASGSRCWDKALQDDIINAIILAPNEVIDFDDDLGIVKTSSNLAMIDTFEDHILIRSSQRSLVNADRDDICAALKTHFELFNAVSTLGSVYPATPPKSDALLLKTAIQCASMNGKSAKPYAIHAGLETGWFSMKNPDLEIISCGPDHHDYHTPNEKLNIPSVGEFDHFLRELIRKISEK